MRHVIAVVLVASCASQTSDTSSSNLSSDQRLARETIIRDVAASRGLHNGVLLAGLAEAELHLAHCWSEATWACPGPQSSDCGGPVVAGAADGPCSAQQGGLGMFQFDAGTYSQTLAAHGDKILNVSGSVEEAVDFVVAMVINSAYTPTTVAARASALAWLDAVTIDGPSWDAWLKTVVHYYNGCPPATCSVYGQRRAAYDAAFRTVRDERGDAFWGQTGTGGGGGWGYPLDGTSWRIGFDVVNPYVPGFGSCFGKPLNQLVHSGEDWANAAGTPVHAIGAGTVVYAQFANYPGSVIVIRHDLSPSEASAIGASTVYSMYGHLANLQVAAGNQVAMGQHIADILDQGANSHTHWEVRTVEVPQLCGYNDPGPGYTDAGTDARNWGYLSPSDSVAALASAGGGSCEQQPTLEACNATPGCAWYACVDKCYPTGTDVNQVCGGGWNCADSSWGGGQVWTCGGDGNRHECSGGSPIVDACANGCMSRNPGQDDLCVQSDPGWSCANSSWGGGQLWTCSGSSIHECQNGSGVRVDCPFGCVVNPLGTNDACN